MSKQATDTFRLKFTGACGRAEFESKCREQDYWYHSYYFDNGFSHSGDYDIGRNIAEYGFPQDMSGMSVLDVGTGSGWFATFFEQRGAKVTAVDVRGAWCDHDVFGRPGYPDITTERSAPDRILPDGRRIYYSMSSKAFWLMKDMLGLQADFVNARVYDLRPELFGGKLFDLVFLGSVLMHLRDPIGALMAIHSVCREKVVATSFVFSQPTSNMLAMPAQEEEPMMKLMSAARSGNPSAWWAPNKACLVQWFAGAGFLKVDADRTVGLMVDAPYGDNVKTIFSHTQALVHACVK